MARRKVIDTIAESTPTQRDAPQNAAPEVDDPFDFFRDETSECLIAVRRIEPAVERGTVVHGHLPSLTLSPAEAQNLASELARRPGYGGGLYAIQHQRRKATGGYEFGSSFRLRVAGPSRALELHEQVQQQNAHQPAPMTQNHAITAPQQPVNNLQGWPAMPPPWWQSVPSQHAAAPSQSPPTSQDLPRLLESMAAIFRAQPSSPLMGQMDVVQLIQSLQKTVQPEKEDELTKLAKFASILDKIRGPQQESSSTPIDFGGIVSAFKELMRGNQAAPMMAPQPRAPMMAPQPRAPMTIPNPPGLRWTGTEWISVEENPRPPTSEQGRGQVENDEDEEEEEETEDEDEDEEIDDETPLTPDELIQVVLAEMQKMPEQSRKELLDKASVILAQ